MKPMEKKEVRFFMDNNLLTRFRILCIKKDLNVPKQMHALVKNFVEIQEENLKHTNKI